jgi:hypothetical protein
MTSSCLIPSRPAHEWLGSLSISFVDSDLAVDQLREPILRLRSAFERLGHRVQETPTEETDVCLTPAEFGAPVDWRAALQVTVRRRFGLTRAPAVHTLMFAEVDEFRSLLRHFEEALRKPAVEGDDFLLPGLAPSAVHPLVEQGRRGGAIVTLLRVLQGQAKCIRLTLIVGKERPETAFFFDLVGGHSQVAVGVDEAQFYTEMATRIATTAGAREVTAHVIDPDRIPAALWASLSTPAAMRRAGEELGRRAFFTDMVRVSDIVAVPAVAESIARQYSEGCFATWEAKLGALVATTTGSARPVDKTALTDDDLAAIIGVRTDRLGAVVRHVDGLSNAPPSSEAVELREVDSGLPTVTLGPEWGSAAGASVPVIRSKLHGHRGIESYNPERIEFVRLPEPYYFYPVSCATDAQASGIRTAFAGAECLLSPDDPRSIAFTILPTHGILIVEKWRPGCEPFEEILQAFDSGDLVVSTSIPQGDHHFESSGPGKNLQLACAPAIGIAEGDAPSGAARQTERRAGDPAATADKFAEERQA